VANVSTPQSRLASRSPHSRCGSHSTTRLSYQPSTLRWRSQQTTRPGVRARAVISPTPDSRNLPWRQPLPGEKRKPSPWVLKEPVLGLEAREAWLFAGLWRENALNARSGRFRATWANLGHLGRLAVDGGIGRVLLMVVVRLLHWSAFESEARAMR